MKIIQRTFSGEEDIQPMISLAKAFPKDSLHVVDLPYRLSSWTLDETDNIGLWVDADGEMLAWAVMQTPFWTIDYAIHPDVEVHLHRQILTWADLRARQMSDTPYQLPSWFVMVFVDQTDRIRYLEDAGFISQADVGEDSWSKVLMQRPVRIPLERSALMEGFSIRPLAGVDEVEAYVNLHRAVFGSKNMTVEWRTRTLRCPQYRSDLDLVAVAPDGRLAAFCVLWFSPAPNPDGHVEPMGVHEDFRKLGLGRAILSEGLRRLFLCGAESVYVETDKYRNAALELYKAVGFQVIRDVLVYRKDYISVRE